jgi:nucleotide-binding universal stress UspA family protein
MFRRILVGWDTSSSAERALRIALDLAADVGAEIVTLTAVQPPEHAETTEDSLRETTSERMGVRAGLEPFRALATSSGVSMSHEIVEASDPADALSRYFEERGFDVLVIGRHGTSRAYHARIGPVAEQLARQAPGPLLLVGDA